MIAVLCSLCLWLPAFSVAMAGIASEDSRGPAKNVTWVPCTMGLPADVLRCSNGVLPLIMCTAINVPINYSAPAGESIALHALRIQSSAEASERRGAVWVLAGGPGKVFHSDPALPLFIQGVF